MENGSVQNIPEIPVEVKEVYKTVWEMSQKRILTMSANRSVFIDQSQSLNMFMAEPTASKLSSAHMFGWKLGLKTGMYYLRVKPKAQALKGLGIDLSSASIQEVEKPKEVEQMKDFNAEEFAAKVCSLSDPDCESCGA